MSDTRDEMTLERVATKSKALLECMPATSPDVIAETLRGFGFSVDRVELVDHLSGRYARIVVDGRNFAMLPFHATAPSAAPRGGAAVDAAGHNGPMDATHNEARDRAAAEARPEVGEATRRVLQTLWWMVERRVHDGSLKPVAIAAWSDETHGRLTDARIEGADILAALREFGMEDAPDIPSEPASCTTPSPSTVIPPDQATWDILCAYLAGEEHHGSDISEGRLTEILKHRIGWCRDDVRAAWYDAVARGNALIEADHERVRPIREAEAARLMAEAERRRGGSERTGSDSSSASS